MKLRIVRSRSCVGRCGLDEGRSGLQRMTAKVVEHGRSATEVRQGVEGFVG